MAWVVSAVAVAVTTLEAAAIATAVMEVGVAMTVVGTVTKSKELTKIGGVLSMAGGIGSLAIGAAGAFGGAAASAAGETAGELGTQSLWADAASEATADASANMATQGVESLAADSFAGGATASSIPDAASGIGAIGDAKGLTTEYVGGLPVGDLTPVSGDIPAVADATANQFAAPAGLNPQASAPPVSDASMSYGGDSAAPSATDATGTIKPTAGQDFGSWFKGLPKETQDRLTTSAVQAGGMAIGGIFNGWTESQKMDLQREIQNQKTSQYNTAMANANAIPTIAFKPVAPRGLISSAMAQGAK